jgi:predicted RNase H-like HicB family nuclease
MKKYLIVIEKTATGYSAYSPDLDGCVSTGATKQEVEKNIYKAVVFHLDGLREGGEIVPEPHTYFTYVEIPTKN